MSRTENRALGGVAPSKYRGKMPADVSTIMDGCLGTDLLFEDLFAPFVEKRATLLAGVARSLCNVA
jgi:hypothetical protein